MRNLFRGLVVIVYLNSGILPVKPLVGRTKKPSYVPPITFMQREPCTMKNTENDQKLVLVIDEPEARALTTVEKEQMARRDQDPAFQQWLAVKEQEADSLFNLPITKE